MNNSKKVNGKWSKKDHRKSSKKVYSRSDKAITLIALIVTIIVLLILAGVTINLAVNNQGIFNKAKTATRTFKNASENEQTGLDEANKEIENYMPPIPGSTLLRKNAPKIKVSGLKYADLDGDGTADGIIVADISEDSKDYPGGNPWGDSYGSFSYTKKEASELRKYSENTDYKYTNADGSTEGGTLITCINNTGTPRYYVLSLANYDGYEHYWYKNADGKMSDCSTSTSKFTSEDFGKGKENTEKMIERMKNHSDTSKYSVDYEEPTTGTYADIWNIIEDKVKEGWFVPSKAEWAAFASYLNASTTNYANYGLNNWYWSSSQRNDKGAWLVGFGKVSMDSGKASMDSGRVENSNSLRLCATF